MSVRPITDAELSTLRSMANAGDMELSNREIQSRNTRYAYAMPLLLEKIAEAEAALRNVYMLATREKRRAKKAIDMAAWTHILRFCEEAGCESNILRREAIEGEQSE